MRDIAPDEQRRHRPKGARPRRGAPFGAGGGGGGGRGGGTPPPTTTAPTGKRAPAPEGGRPERRAGCVARLVRRTTTACAALLPGAPLRTITLVAGTEYGP